MKEKLLRILQFLNLSDIGFTLNEITIHTNIANPILLLEVLKSMGYVRIIDYYNQCNQAEQKYKITSSGRKLLLSHESCELIVPLSILEDVMISYELATKKALRIY